MITQTDSLNSVEFDSYFVILPSTPLWGIENFRKESNTSNGQMCEFGFSYNSKTNTDFLTVTQIKTLIKENLDY